MLVPIPALISRRLHDTNRSFAYVFLGVILPPILIYALFDEGTSGDNDYGEDPRIEENK